MIEKAINILNIIENNGYNAYIVGGYIRDLLLNNKSSDIDLASNATPNDLYNIFGEKLVMDNYGSSRLLYDGEVFEITTFRKEEKYIKNRKPSKISYVDSIYDDVNRRDFTMNALYMDKNMNIIDLVNGKEDIKNRIIRSIGDPFEKINEDSFRILRCIRFSCTLKFSIDQSLEKAIIMYKKNLKNISHLRKREEIEKIIKSDNYKLGLYLLNKYNLYEELGIKVNNIIKTSDVLGFWAQVDLLEDYEFSKKEKIIINNIKEIINYGKIDDNVLNKYNELEISISKEIIEGGLL